MRKPRSDRGKTRRNYNRSKIFSKPITIRLKEGIYEALRQKQKETGLGNSELIGNILWMYLCDNEAYFISEIERMARCIEAYKYKIKTMRLNKGIVIKND